MGPQRLRTSLLYLLIKKVDRRHETSTRNQLLLLTFSVVQLIYAFRGILFPFKREISWGRRVQD